MLASTRKPKEVIIATLMRPDGDTGVQTSFNQVRRWLKQSGVKVSLVTPFSAPKILVYPMFAPRLLLDKINGPASVWWYRYWHYVFLKQALRQRLRDEDVTIYAQCPVSAQAALEARRSPRQRVVLVVHFNVSQSDEWVSKGLMVTNGRYYRSIRQLEAVVLPRLDGIVYLSDFVRRAVEQDIPAVAAVPSILVPNFIGSRTDAAQDGPSGDLINIGTLEPRKNQEFLLRVLAEAGQRGKRYTLTLVGEGPDRRRLETLAVELGVASQVTFLGRVLDAARFLPAHRVYCHSASMENMPIALIEALSCGLPILAAPVGGIPEVFRDGVEGYYWNLDQPGHSAAKMVQLLEDSTTRQRMSIAAKKRFAVEFEENVVGARLLPFLLDGRRE
ncbi:MAG TPA: glycosyltransferase family 4 protein [Verrucomicrobiae bacterium]|nr:glycosyltransferase family 4 protein [Verrucomicrobiae bacterium]